MPASKDADIHWFGIISKGELANAYIEDGMVTVPKGEGKTPFPFNKAKLHLVHMGGGAGASKNNWQAFFSEESWKYIQENILND